MLALTAFFAATGLVFITSNLFPIDHSTFSVMLLIGLAVGVDYSLFYIRREREERAAGRSADAALQAAAATSGRSVLISGLTVIVAVAGLFFTGTGEFRGIAAGTMIVVATSVLGSVTVLPALLSKLGDRIEKGRLPLVHRLRRRNRENRFWNAVLTPVLRRPAIAAISATAILIALAVPALQLHTVQPGTTDYPKSMPILQTEARIQNAFPGGPMPAQIVVKADNIGDACDPGRTHPLPDPGARHRPRPRADLRPHHRPARRDHLRAARRHRQGHPLKPGAPDAALEHHPRDPRCRPRACRPSPSEATPHRPRTTTTP